MADSWQNTESALFFTLMLTTTTTDHQSLGNNQPKSIRICEYTESTVLRWQEEKADSSFTVLGHHIVPDHKGKSFCHYKTRTDPWKGDAFANTIDKVALGIFRCIGGAQSISFGNRKHK